MEYRLVTRGVESSEAMEEYLSKKMSRLDRVAPEGDHVKLDVKMEKERADYIVEFTLKVRGGVIRVEEHSNDPYVSIDSVVDSMEKKLLKFKTKRMVRHKSGVKGVGEDIANQIAPSQEDSDEETDVEKTKRFFLQPMSVEEAKLQLEMLGHTFFVFKNAETEEVNLIYRRKSKGIGLIEFDM